MANHPAYPPNSSGSPDRRFSRRPRGPLTVTAPLALGLALLLGWHLLATSGRLRANLFPAPAVVWSKLVTGLVTSGVYWPFIGETFEEAALGCLVGTVVALPLAVVTVHNRWVAAAVTPFLGATQAIPAVALAPLLVLWVGYGLKAVVALCALMVFFPILVSAVVGLRHVDRSLLDAAALDGAGFWARLTYMEFPLAGATILAGIRNGFTLSVTGAFVGEMVMGGHGLGTLVGQQQNNDTAGLFASIIIMAVFASTVYSLITLIEKKVFSYEGR
ncbi:MAG: ABC transporter permease [Propionibacteriaceae bacterium]|jgi:NitT/TauT family transport system permease protein|nr:ABC transporter permease [Propionibacteriaceae bacterium]